MHFVFRISHIVYIFTQTETEIFHFCHCRLVNIQPDLLHAQNRLMRIDNSFVFFRGNPRRMRMNMMRTRDREAEKQNYKIEDKMATKYEKCMPCLVRATEICHRTDF